MSDYLIRKYSNKVERRDFAKVSKDIKLTSDGSEPIGFEKPWELPNLIETHTKSFKRFLEDELVKSFKDTFPIVSANGRYELVFQDLWLENPRRSMAEAKYSAQNYEAPIYAAIYLKDNETGEIKEIKKTKKNPKGAVFFGDLPLMTPKATFVINGTEKVVINQIVKSPGSYFKAKTDEKTGRTIFINEINPARGAWVESETNSNNILNVRIDKSKRLNAFTFLQALGILAKPEVKGDDDTAEKRLTRYVRKIEKLFGHSSLIYPTANEDLAERLEDGAREIYQRLRPGEPYTFEGAINSYANLLFNPRRYDLTDAGRYKMNRKLKVTQRLFNRVLAEDLKDVKGTLIMAKGTLIQKPQLDVIKAALRDGSLDVTEQVKHEKDLATISGTEMQSLVEVIKVYTDNEAQKQVANIIGTHPTNAGKTITISDIVAAISYSLGMEHGIGNLDDIDHLGNRRMRLIHELLKNQVRVGLARIEKNIKEKMATTDEAKITPKSIINIKPLTAVVKEFFNSYQLTQFMDQMNPLSELTNKRRLTALGPGGLSRDRAGFEVRDVHYSHYGRLCPIETPEGQNIGLINNLSSYAKVNDLGFLQTPYKVVEKNKDGKFIVTNRVKYLTATEEDEYIIAGANIAVDEKGVIQTPRAVARYRGSSEQFPVENIDFADTSPKQVVSVATALIPFLENDDANRALMGANMQRQAVPLIKADAPYVGTGIEYFVGRDSGLAQLADFDGTIKYADSEKIILADDAGEEVEYKMDKFQRSNQESVINHSVICEAGDKVKKNDVLADGSSMVNGELAIGQNLLVAFTTWNGYNYEDAIIMSDRLVKEDVLTSMHIVEYVIESRKTKLGDEEVTREVPNVSDDVKKYLDESGIITLGAEVKEGDILVGKVTPKGQTDLNPEERLLQAIFGEKAKNVKDSSLKVPHGGDGVVAQIKRFSEDNGDSLDSEVIEVVKIYILQKRKIQVGDKMAGRHGNKGVISRILAAEDMPHLPDGTPVDIMLNPLGIPSRMNIGQILEIHLGLAAKKLGVNIATPVFEGASNEDLISTMEEANLQEWGFDKSGKVNLTDGITGEKFDKPISVGVMYMLKLGHMVDDKLHGRSVGPYSKITQQPLGGKAQKGGQRFGEMEVWALEAYGAAHTLREILTIKSDDIRGRNSTYNAIVKGWDIPEPGLPESFRLLTKELQGLGLYVKLLDDKGDEHQISEYEAENIEDMMAQEGISVDIVEDGFDVEEEEL